MQPPAIYRQFGDKQGLLDAVTGFVLHNYLQDKRRAVVTHDPLQDMRDSWDLHVDFGLTHPAVTSCLRPASARHDAGPGPRIARNPAPADRANRRAWPASESVKRATEVMHGAAVGYVLSQIRVTPEERDPQLSEIMRESTLAAIATVGPRHPAPSDLPGRAVALRRRCSATPMVR